MVFLESEEGGYPAPAAYKVFRWTPVAASTNTERLADPRVSPPDHAPDRVGVSGGGFQQEVDGQIGFFLRKPALFSAALS